MSRLVLCYYLMEAISEMWMVIGQHSTVDCQHSMFLEITQYNVLIKYNYWICHNDTLLYAMIVWCVNPLFYSNTIAAATPKIEYGWNLINFILEWMYLFGFCRGFILIFVVPDIFNALQQSWSRERVRCKRSQMHLAEKSEVSYRYRIPAEGGGRGGGGKWLCG